METEVEAEAHIKKRLSGRGGKVAEDFKPPGLADPSDDELDEDKLEKIEHGGEGAGVVGEVEGGEVEGGEVEGGEVEGGEVEGGEVEGGEVEGGEVEEDEVEEDEVEEDEVEEGEVQEGEVQEGEVKEGEVNGLPCQSGKVMGGIVVASTIGLPSVFVPGIVFLKSIESMSLLRHLQRAHLAIRSISLTNLVAG